jgi:hypothetical protein
MIWTCTNLAPTSPVSVSTPRSSRYFTMGSCLLYAAVCSHGLALQPEIRSDGMAILRGVTTIHPVPYPKWSPHQTQ